MSRLMTLQRTSSAGTVRAAERVTRRLARRAIIRLYTWTAEWYRRSRSRDELARFSPAMLRDIGITPADRENECNKPFWQP